jgi:zinc protease
MKRFLGSAIVLVIVAVWVVGGHAQTSRTEVGLPPGVQKQASLGGITEYDFANGLRVLLYPDAASPKLTVNVTYLVGSRHEGYGEGGMAHLLEHMNLIETTNGRKIKDELTAHGAQWNGATTPDRTSYFETVTASDENLQWALGLEADRMINVRIARELLDVEMTVVRNEFEAAENNAVEVLHQRVLSVAYSWHNYGKPAIGTREDIERVPIDRLAAFYRKFYRPDNAVLVISGRFDESRALRFAADTIGRIPKPEAPLDSTYTVEPPQDGERFVELRRVGELKNVIIAYHGPASAHPDWAALNVLAGIMNGPGAAGRGGRGRGGPPVQGGAQGRLFKALVDTRKALRAAMSIQPTHDPYIVTVLTGLSSGQSQDDVRHAIIETLEGVIANPPSNEEIEQVKTDLLLNSQNQMSDAQNFGVFLSQAIAHGDWRLFFVQQNRLKDVAPADVVRVARQYLKSSNRTVGYFTPDTNPDRTIVPEAPDLSDTLRNLTTSVSVSRGEAFDPLPRNVEARIRRGRLSNGMTLTVLTKASVNNMVVARVDLTFGDAGSLTGKEEAAQMVLALAPLGTRNRTRPQLQSEMTRLNASINFAGNDSLARALIQVPAANFEAAFRLAVEMQREPSFPEFEFDTLKSQAIGNLSNEVTEPAQLAQDTLERHLSPFPAGHPRYPARREERLVKIRTLTLDDVKAFHDRFYAASHGQVTIVGPVEYAAVQSLAEQLLASWNRPERYARMRPAYRAVSAINQKIETVDKANARLDAGLLIPLSPDDEDYPALVMANYLLGGSWNRGRLPNRIRNREGLSYNVRTALDAWDDGMVTRFHFWAISNPGNTPKVEASFRDELRAVLEEGFSEEEVAAGKQAYLDAQLLNRTNDLDLLVQVSARAYHDQSFLWFEDQENEIRALTAEHVTAVLRKYVDPDSISIVKAGDFRAAGAYR